MYGVYFWTLRSIPLVCTAVPRAIPYCFDYHSFCSKSQNGKLSILWLCSSVLRLFWPFWVPCNSINFRGSSCRFLGVVVGLLIEISLNLVQFGEYCHLNNTECSNPWIRMSFPLFWSLSFLSVLFCGFQSTRLILPGWHLFLSILFFLMLL